MATDVYCGFRLLSVSPPSFILFFSYFTLAGNSEERLTDLIYKLKTTFVTCTIELDLQTSNRSNLCFDFAVLREHLGPVLKRPEKTCGGFPRSRTNFTPHQDSSVHCVFGNYTAHRQKYTCILRTRFVDLRLNLPLRSQRTIFNTVRQILIHFFVILFTAF